MQIIYSAISISVPLLLAATGGLFCELSGSLNIALEGLLLIGAFTSVVAAHFVGNVFLGVLIGMSCAMLLSYIQAIITFKMKANMFIAGLAANLLASGLCTVLSFKFFNNKGVVVFNDVQKLKVLNFPIPGQTIFTYIALLLLVVSYFVLYKTPFGIHLRCCGKNETALVSLGLKPDFYRVTAYIISGATCALGGALLTLNLGSFVPNISNGKGWMALVIIFLGNKNPWGLLAASLVFGLADSFSNFAQGALNVPADFILAIPYIFTLIAMLVFSIIVKKKKEFK